MKLSPLQKVRADFGSKEELARKLLSSLDRPEGESEAEFQARILTASNRKLLRLHRAEERVSKDFGSKDALVARIVELKFGGRGDDAYRTKIAGFAKTRLLDLHDALARRAARA